MKKFFIVVAISMALGFILVTLGAMNVAAAAKGEPLVVPYELVKWGTPIWLIASVLCLNTTVRNLK